MSFVDVGYGSGGSESGIVSHTLTSYGNGAISSYAEVVSFKANDCTLTIHQYWNIGGWGDATYPIKIEVDGVQEVDNTNTINQITLSGEHEITIYGHTNGNNYQRKYVITDGIN